MCGIITLLSLQNQEFLKNILESLKQIQNRGYDSAGISYINNNKIYTNKYASDEISALEKLNKNIDSSTKSSNIIAHTRWATHGAKTDNNSHPHLSWNNKLSLVHNGIIENYQEIKSFLINKNINFKSQTDSEVIANLIEYNYQIYNNLERAIKESISELQGTWGLAIIHQDFPNKVFCIRHGSPLLIGIDDNFVMVSSELYGFANKIKNYFVLENNDLAIISNNINKIDIKTTNIYKIKNLNQSIIKLTPEPYPHWTIKEIMEQPEAIMRAISFGGRILDENQVKLGGLINKKDILKRIDNLIILGCGTSLHAGLIGAEFFKELCHFNTIQVFDGAEFNITDIPKIGNTGLIYLSQSGETKDLHRCIKICKDNDLFNIGVVNVVDSLIARDVDCGCYLNAGREVGVASTKAFTNQVILLSMIAIWFAQEKNINFNKRNRYIKDLRKLSQDYRKSIEICEKYKELLESFINTDSIFILGKGKSRYVAREGALKIKELCYLHAEGYGGSALKHGPFALLDKDHPVILLAPDNNFYSKMWNAAEEIISRFSPVLIISNKEINNENVKSIVLPTNETYQDLLGIIPLQLAAYYCSIKRNINCDQPKNLAKCVNVE